MHLCCMEGTFGGEMLATLVNDHKFAKFSPTKFYMPQIDLEYNINFEMECPRFYESSRT